MKEIKTAFQMEDFESLDSNKDNSLILIQEALRRKHEVWQYNVNSLTLSSEGVFALARKIIVIELDKKPFFKTEKAEQINLEYFDIINVRNDPPFDMCYITATYILEKVLKKTFIVNPPNILRDFPEKISPLNFPDIIPPTLITQNIDEIKIFLKKYKNIIVKPLYLFGGQDVYKFSEDNFSEVEISNLIKRSETAIVTQKYLRQVVNGDKRILLINGEIIAGFIRIPQKGNVRANLMQGGKLEKTKITKRDKEICQTINDFLVKNQIIACGIDIIGDYLTEINITSMIGFREIEKLYELDAKKIYWDAIEEKINL